jgi:hypothetical protein
MWPSAHFSYRKDAWDVTPEQHEDGLRRIEFYKQWILKTVLRGNRNTVIISLLGEVQPCYRDEWPGYVSSNKCLHVANIGSG